MKTTVPVTGTGNTRSTHERQKTEDITYLTRIHSSLKTAASLVESLRTTERQADGGPDELLFHLDATAFAIAVDSWLFFGMPESHCVLSSTIEKAGGVLGTARGLIFSVEAVEQRLQGDRHDGSSLDGALRNMQHVVFRLEKGLDALCRSWIMADLCLLALITRARADAAGFASGR